MITETVRSYDQLKSRDQQLNEIMQEYKIIQTRLLERRAAFLANQKQMEHILAEFDATLQKQETDLDKLKSLVL